MAPPVLVDHREAGSGLPERLAGCGLDIESVDLPVGDYVLAADLAVERKSSWDLTASIKDGRLFDQAMRLQDAYPRAVLLIEGEPQGMPESSWRGAVCRLVEDGVTVLRTDGMADSAEWLLRLALRAQRRGLAQPVPLRAKGQRRSPPTVPAQAAAMLACAPGISQGTALRLLAHFGSVQAIAGADESALREVEGVGPVRAGALLSVLRWSASGEER